MDTKDVKSGRPNLDSSLISSELDRRSCTWVDFAVLESVASTNDEVIARLQSQPVNVPVNVIVVTADEQTQGRGRLQRDWSSPKGAGIALSIGSPLSTYSMEPSTIPLVVGVAVIEALNEFGVNANLKWPNDIIFVSEANAVRKVGGILLQRIGEHVVVGVGLNVSLNTGELPTETATSLSLEGYEISREELIVSIVSNLEKLALDNSEIWRTKYLETCATLGSQVRVILADGSQTEGHATQISQAGGLIVEVEGAAIEVTVGDIEHLRHL